MLNRDISDTGDGESLQTNILKPALNYSVKLSLYIGIDLGFLLFCVYHFFFSFILPAKHLAYLC